MKFIHVADVHLGSVLKRFSSLLSNERNGEIVAAFLKTVDYARKNDIKTVVIAGDLFDSNVPLSQDKEVFHSAVKSNPDMTFLYLRGNHDNVADLSLPNLLTFEDSVKSYEIDGAIFSGVEINDDNYSTFYDEIDFDAKKKNVLILHGEASNAAGLDKIDLSRLKGKGIDYLALGHIHSYYEGKIDDKGVYVNPGCLEGRGFDEKGEKGFVVVDSADFSHEFIVNSLRVVKELEVDVSETKNVYEALDLARKAIDPPSKDVIRIILKGGVKYPSDVRKTLYDSLKNECFYLEVKDETYQAVKVEDYLNDLSLKGEFIRVALSDESLSEEDKRRIVALGLNLLDGRKI